MQPGIREGNAKERLAEIVDHYNTRGFLPRIFMTGPGRDIREELKGLSEDDMLVCSGGDGMVNFMIDNMASMGDRHPLWLYPHGHDK